MQSKTSYSKFWNATLFRKNLTRFWPLWGMTSFLGALFPLALIWELIRDNSYMAGALDFTSVYYSAVAYAAPIISLCYAVLCAMAVWGYLFNARSVGMYHTLPIRREGLFVTNFLSGMAMMLIPYVVVGGLLILISLFCGAFDPVGTGITILGVLGESFFYFATATAVAFLTGHTFAMPALYFLFHFLALMVEGLCNLLGELFLFGVSARWSGVLSFLSPTYYLCTHLDVDHQYKEIPVPGKAWTNNVLVAVKPVNFWMIGAYALVGILLLAVAYVLYRKRHSESAGDVAAARWMKPVYRYGLTALVGIPGGMAIYGLFFGNYDDVHTLGMAVCMTVAAVICYYLASMLLAKSLRVFNRKTMPGAIAVVACACILCAGLRFDILGIASRVPSIDQVTRLEFRTASNSYYLTPEKDAALLEQAIEVQQAIVADQEYIRRNSDGSYSVPDGMEVQETTISCAFYYTLRNGRTLDRYYWIPIERSRLTEAGTYDQMLNALINSEGMCAKRLHLNDPAFRINGGYFRNYAVDSKNKDTSDYFSDVELSSSYFSSYDLNSREAAALQAAIGRDAANGNWGFYDWFNKDDGNYYATELHLYFDYDPDGSGDYWSSDNIQIRLTSRMTETIDCLEELELVDRSLLKTNRELYPENYESDEWDWNYDEFGPWDASELDKPEVTAVPRSF